MQPENILEKLIAQVWRRSEEDLTKKRAKTAKPQKAKNNTPLQTNISASSKRFYYLNYLFQSRNLQILNFFQPINLNFPITFIAF